MLRKGKPKTILEGSLDSALLAVEIYNKPRTTFRTQGFISMMIIAWTRLFHAHFHRTIGDRYYVKNENGRFKIVNGEKWAWDLVTCIKEYNKQESESLSEAVVANLKFFLGLRHKVEHRSLERSDLDALAFGECQALLFNYESLVIKLFGVEHALNENLVYSLQFSHIRTDSQKISNRLALSSDLKEVRDYIHKYRNGLDESIFASQEFSIKLIQIPRISNTSRNDLAVEFVKWDEVDPNDRKSFNKLTAIIKNKVVRQEGTNIGKLKPSHVVKKVDKSVPFKFTLHHNTCLVTIFDVRPPSGAEDPFLTKTEYCHYDEPHSDYLYNEDWVNFIINLATKYKWDGEMMNKKYQSGERLEPSSFPP